MSIHDQRRLAGITESESRSGYGTDDFYGRSGMDDPYGRRSEVEADRQAELARIHGELDGIEAARDAAEKAAEAAVRLVLELEKLDTALEEAGRPLAGKLKKLLENESEKLGRAMSDLQHYAKNRVDDVLVAAEKSARAELKDYGG